MHREFEAHASTPKTHIPDKEFSKNTMTNCCEPIIHYKKYKYTHIVIAGVKKICD